MEPKNVTAEEKNSILQAIEDGRRVYQERRTIMKHIRKVRALRIDTRVPRTFQAMVGRGVRNPLPYALVQTINGLVAKGQPQFHREPLKPQNREAAQKLAATCWPLMQTYSRIAKKDLFYQIVDQLAGDGMSVVKFKRTALKDFPEFDGENQSAREYNKMVEEYLSEGMGRNPFRIERVDPMVFWPDPSDEPLYVIESGRRPLGPVLSQLGMKFGVNNKLMPTGSTRAQELLPSGQFHTEDFSEVWTDEAVYLSIGGDVHKFENDLGFIPYTWRYGMTTSIPDPALEAMSVVFPFYAMDPYINTLFTSLLSWAVMSGMPTAVVTQDPIPNMPTTMREEHPTDIPLGQMISLPPGKKFGYAQPPPIGQEVIRAIDMFLSFYDRAGVTSAARGVIGTRTPGLTFTSALEAATDMIEPIKTSTAGILEDIVVMTWKAIEQFNLPIQVTGWGLEEGTKKLSKHKISPRDISGYYDIHCTLQPMSDQQMVSRGMHGAFMKDKGLWSSERAMTYGGVENTELERRLILEDAIRQSPLYLQQAMSAALEQVPDLSAAAQEQIQQGMDPLGLMGGGTTAVPEGQGQIRGEAPRGGGRPAGMSRLPTGPGNGGSGERNPA